MNLFRRQTWLAVLTVFTLVLPGMLSGQVIQSPTTNALAKIPGPPVPPPPSRTREFRKLLEMAPADQAQYLSNRPANVQRLLAAKIQEYASMERSERESRLWATELHEYLEYFLSNPPGDRASQLAQIPEDYRSMVSNRLTQFNLLPPPLRQEVLAQESTSNYFIGPSLASMGASLNPPPPMPPDPLKSLGGLTSEERQEVYAGFEHYFDLPENEKQQVLALVPAAERPRVARTLAELDQMPANQREQGLHAIGTLVGMTGEQRRLFLQNAERWKSMSPAERETWLKLVSHLPPLPPSPAINPLSLPPMPPSSLPRPPLSAATNPGN